MSLLAGCAVFQPENRRLTNQLDAHLAPESSTLSWALVPVTLPAGVLSICADAVVVHPAASIDDAWLDTRDLLWRPRDESAFRKAVMAPVAALLTPIVFGGDWLGRSLFNIAPYRDQPEEPRR